MYQHLQVGVPFMVPLQGVIFHHPLGFNWHPFEGAGILFTSPVFVVIRKNTSRSPFVRPIFDAERWKSGYWCLARRESMVEGRIGQVAAPSKTGGFLRKDFGESRYRLRYVGRRKESWNTPRKVAPELEDRYSSCWKRRWREIGNVFVECFFRFHVKLSVHLCMFMDFLKVHLERVVWSQ